MTTTQEQAAKYAETLFSPQHTLSWLSANDHDLRSGAFSWEVEPVVGAKGDWYMPGHVPPLEMVGRPALLRIVTPLLVDGAIAVIEDPIRGRKESYDIEQLHDVRPLFKGSGSEVETFFVAGPRRPTAAIELVAGMIGGASRFFGIVTRAPDIRLPASGGDVTEEQLRDLVAGATHMIFRGPSYDAYILWTAGGGGAD